MAMSSHALQESAVANGADGNSAAVGASDSNMVISDLHAGLKHSVVSSGDTQWEEARLEGLLHMERVAGVGTNIEVVGSNNSLESVGEGYMAEGEESSSSMDGAAAACASLCVREVAMPVHLQDTSGSIVVLD